MVFLAPLKVHWIYTSKSLLEAKFPGNFFIGCGGEPPKNTKIDIRIRILLGNVTTLLQSVFLYLKSCGGFNKSMNVKRCSSWQAPLNTSKTWKSTVVCHALRCERGGVVSEV